MDKRHVGSVLIVDDEAKLRFLLRAHLETAGFEVFEAGDGLEAVDAAIANEPDLIVMDVKMPRLDGIEATRRLRGDARTEAIPIIILTGRASTQDLVTALEAGAQEYLRKPFDMTELLARVRTVHRLVLAHKDLDNLNRRLVDEVRVKTRRLESLYDYMRVLHNADTQDKILDLVIRCMQDVTRARRISIMLTDPDGEHLVCVRAIGIDPKIVEKIRVSPMEGVAGQVFQSGKTLAAQTFGDEAAGRRAYETGAFVSTPLRSTSTETSGGILGVVNVTERQDDQPFSQEEVECIRAVADAAAIALDSVERRERLEASVRILLQTVGHLAEYRDEETTHHLDRVSIFAEILGGQLLREGPYRDEVAGEFVEMLVQAAPLHDIGKVGIPDDILTKPGALSDEEFEIMKTHTEIGRKVLSTPLHAASPVPLLAMCVDIAHCHHERFDGAGYPRGIAGDEIPLSARILALVDAYDAITSKRRYKDARSHGEAFDIIRYEAGRHFDPALVEAFVACEEQFNKVRSRYANTPEPAPALTS